VASFGGPLTLERIREKLGVLGIDELNEFARLLRAGDPGAVLERLDAVLAAGISIEQFIANLAEYFRNLLFLKNGVAKDTLLGYAPGEFDAGVLDSLDSARIEKAIELLLSLYRNIRFSLNQRFELELTISRLAQLDVLISPAEIRAALRDMRGQLLGSPGARVASTPRQAAHPGAAPAVDPETAVRRTAEAMRRGNPALASALDKVLAAALDGEDLVLSFSIKDRFQGEMVLKDKDMLAGHLRPLVPAAERVRIAWQESRVAPQKVDQRVELLRKVFRGEVVEGDKHGDQSV
jgi:DNA polymerase III gamma/tau subunit